MSTMAPPCTGSDAPGILESLRRAWLGRTGLFRLNFLIRVAFLLVTPTLFRWLTLGFIWHSIYWGAVTVVVLLWTSMVLVSPLLGRVGCGWMCFVGTLQDLGGTLAPRDSKAPRARPWFRVLVVLLFLGSAGVFFLMRHQAGSIPGWRWAPNFLPPVFNDHYKVAWLIDTFVALGFSLVLNKRWLCRACPVGTLCAVGASHARLLPVVERDRCNGCRRCEKACPVAVPILDLAEAHQGHVVDGECLNCGACQAACSRECLKVKFVWKRKTLQAAEAPAVPCPGVLDAQGVRMGPRGV